MRPRIGITVGFQEDDPSAYGLSDRYVQAVVTAGGLPLLLACTEALEPRDIGAVVDGLLIPGGGDIDPIHFDEEPDRCLGSVDPSLDAWELALCRYFLAQDTPILGICRGAQVLNVAAGGDLYQDIVAQTDSRLQHAQRAPGRYASHWVDTRDGTTLARLAGTPRVRVNSFHHQAVRRVAPGFVASATASDGVIEAIERTDGGWAVGVQWHPEKMPAAPLSTALFLGFVDAAGSVPYRSAVHG